MISNNERRRRLSRFNCKLWTRSKVKINLRSSLAQTISSQTILCLEKRWNHGYITIFSLSITTILVILSPYFFFFYRFYIKISLRRIFRAFSYCCRYGPHIQVLSRRAAGIPTMASISSFTRYTFLHRIQGRVSNLMPFSTGIRDSIFSKIKNSPLKIIN